MYEAHMAKLIQGINDLVTVNPELALQWHPTKNGELKPDQIAGKSNKKMWWLGPCGHEWPATVNDRNRGFGCPYCSGQKVLSGFNDLATKYPAIALEWDYEKNGDLTPDQVSCGSGKIINWRCRKGHEYKASINHRANRGDGCPECAKEKKTSFPEQAIYYYLKQITEVENRYLGFGKEIDIYLPEYKIGIEYNGAYYHSDKKRDEQKLKFFSEKGIRIISVNEGSSNCTVGNVIEYVYASTRRESLNWVIGEIFRLLNLRTVPINVMKDESKIYEQYVVQEKENSISYKCPEIAKEWNHEKNGDLNPDQISYLSHKRVWWKCEKGHEYQAIVSARTRGSGCSICAGKKVLTGFNDLESQNPELAKEWHPTKNEPSVASEVTLFSHKKVWWKCKEEHEWQATIASRAQGIGCPVCHNKKVVAGKNDLQSTNPALAKEWHPVKNGDLLPCHVTAGSGKKVWWLCSKGHEWEAYINNRNKGSGCPECAGDRNFSKNKKVLCVETGEMFNSMRAAAKKMNISNNAMASWSKGKTETAGGYHWKFVE